MNHLLKKTARPIADIVYLFTFHNRVKWEFQQYDNTKLCGDSKACKCNNTKWKTIYSLKWTEAIGEAKYHVNFGILQNLPSIGKYIYQVHQRSTSVIECQAYCKNWSRTPLTQVIWCHVHNAYTTSTIYPLALVEENDSAP